MFALDAMLVVAGALTGMLVGLTGVGGGAVMTPLLLLVFGVAPMSAIGTDLWFAAITKVAATRVHHGKGLIDWQVVRRLWAGSLPASALTLVWMAVYPIGTNTAAFLKVSIACAVVLTALAMLFQKQLHALGRRFRTTTESAERFKAIQAPMTVAAGALLGALVTLTSIGAGALGVVFLAYLYPLRPHAFAPDRHRHRACDPAGDVRRRRPLADRQREFRLARQPPDRIDPRRARGRHAVEPAAAGDPAQGAFSDPAVHGLQAASPGLKFASASKNAHSGGH